MCINAYISTMSRSASLPALPDLFDDGPQRLIVVLDGRHHRSRHRLPELSSMSNARLARHLIELTRELQQRKAGRAGRSSRSELDQALQEALPALEALVPKRGGRMKRSAAAAAAPALQEAKRKAIRTALQAGVSPGQVAKHFGLSLAAVRQVLTQAEER